MAMNKTFINEAEVFAVNEDLEIQTVYVGPSKILIIDNFYKNPDMVRDLAISIPPSVNERIASNLPVGPDSGRINAFYLFDHFGDIIDNIVKTKIPELYNRLPPNYYQQSFMNATFLCNVMTGRNLPPRCPHVDNPVLDFYAGLIYLNTPDECQGGTGFYTFGGKYWGTGGSMDVEGKIPVDHYINDSECDWKLEYLAEMKYNRFVMYPQLQYHTAYIKPDMFTDGTYRINQVFFI